MWCGRLAGAQRRRTTIGRVESVLVDESVHARPAAPLRGLVAWYAGYRQRGLPPTQHRGLPSPFLTLILTLDEPLSMAAHPDPRDPPGDYGTLLGGLHTSPALIRVPGRQSGVQIALNPLGARALLGLPAGELGGLDLPADVVLGPDTAEIQDRLRTAGNWHTRFVIIDSWLIARLHGGAAGTLAPEIRHAWQMLLAAGGTASIAAIAAETGWSDRHFRNRFTTETGLTPKAAARVIRFHRARRLLAACATSGSVSLAALAVECGYYDQAHLDREFRALAGISPSGWLTEEFRNIQSGRHHPEAGLDP